MGFVEKIQITKKVESADLLNFFSQGTPKRSYWKISKPIDWGYTTSRSHEWALEMSLLLRQGFYAPIVYLFRYDPTSQLGSVFLPNFTRSIWVKRRFWEGTWKSGLRNSLEDSSVSSTPTHDFRFRIGSFFFSYCDPTYFCGVSLSCQTMRLAII